MAATAQNPSTPAITPTEFMRLLADETRLRALLLLQQKGELCVCELTEALQVSQPKMSRHLAQLRDAGIVETRRAGQWIHYRLVARLPRWALQLLDNLVAELQSTEPFGPDRHRIIRAIARNRSECEQ